MQIKNLFPTLPEIGKIKIGIKGNTITSTNNKEFQPPKKLDHFLITTLERGSDGNFLRNSKMHDIVGDKPRALYIRLLYDDPDLNFQTRYVCYMGMKLFCTGDGEQAIRLQNDGKSRNSVNCPCEKSDPAYSGRDKCKPSGVLSVILENSQIVGGVWKFRTTSYNSVINIMSSLAMIHRITGGVLSGIPLQLVLSKKAAIIPTTQQQTTIHAVGLIYNGSMKELSDVGAKVALGMAENRAKIEHIEEIARAELNKSIGLLTHGETDSDIVDEFFPEQREDIQTQPQPAVNNVYGGEPTNISPPNNPVFPKDADIPVNVTEAPALKKTTVPYQDAVKLSPEPEEILDAELSAEELKNISDPSPSNPVPEWNFDSYKGCRVGNYESPNPQDWTGFIGYAYRLRATWPGVTLQQAQDVQKKWTTLYPNIPFIIGGKGEFIDFRAEKAEPAGDGMGQNTKGEQPTELDIARGEVKILATEFGQYYRIAKTSLVPSKKIRSGIEIDDYNIDECKAIMLITNQLIDEKG